MDFSKTKISLCRPITSYSKVQSIISSIIRNRLLYMKLRKITNKEYLDIGCGPNVHENYINLDYNWHPKIDICWDVTKGIPLRSETVKGIFTEHCLEHIPFCSIDFVLRECWRILRPGGAIRICMPDGELYLSRYIEIIHGVDTRLPYAEGDRYQGLYSPIMSVNRIFRSHGHLFIYDFDALRQLLGKNGFISIEKETFKSGRDPRLLIDAESHLHESLYVEASKANV